MTKKQTLLTLEVFEEVLMPQIRNLINELRDEFSHLPTKEEYYTREDKTMSELKKIREEQEVINNLYQKTNKRVDIIDRKLGIDTSVVF